METTEAPPQEAQKTGAEALKALGSAGTKYDYGLVPGWTVNEPAASILERFEFPGGSNDGNTGAMNVTIDLPEFTCLCPKTGQPDFAHIKVAYVPDRWCVESKSVKLYLMQYRMYGIFHEAFCRRFANDLISLLDPILLQLQTNFNSRGGTAFHPMYNYKRPEGAIAQLPPGARVRPGPGSPSLHRP